MSGIIIKKVVREVTPCSIVTDGNFNIGDTIGNMLFDAALAGEEVLSIGIEVNEDEWKSYVEAVKAEADEKGMPVNVDEVRKRARKTFARPDTARAE